MHLLCEYVQKQSFWHMKRIYRTIYRYCTCFKWYRNINFRPSPSPKLKKFGNASSELIGKVLQLHFWPLLQMRDWLSNASWLYLHLDVFLLGLITVWSFTLLIIKAPCLFERNEILSGAPEHPENFWTCVFCDSAMLSPPCQQRIVYFWLNSVCKRSWRGALVPN